MPLTYPCFESSWLETWSPWSGWLRGSRTRGKCCKSLVRLDLYKCPLASGKRTRASKRGSEGTGADSVWEENTAASQPPRLLRPVTPACPSPHSSLAWPYPDHRGYNCRLRECWGLAELCTLFDPHPGTPESRR